MNATKQSNAFVAIPATNDVTVTTYTGAAINNPPVFSKNVVYPTTAMARSTTGRHRPAATRLISAALSSPASRGEATSCTPPPRSTAGDVQRSASSASTPVRVSRSVRTEDKLSDPDADWFDPDLAIDGAGNVLRHRAGRGRLHAGPSLAVFARKSSGTWVKGPFRREERRSRSTSPATRSTGGTQPGSGRPDLPVGRLGRRLGRSQTTTSVARVSLAKNKATIKASDTKVNKGSKVTFTVKLARPDSKDTIKGLPVALQKSPKSGSNWSTVKSGKTSAKGTAQWKLKIKKAAKYRTLGKKVKQTGGSGRAVDKVTSKAVTVNLK